MGFSVSGATAVVFVGLLVSAATLFPAVERAGERRMDAIDGRDERSLDRQNTAITITAATYDLVTNELVVTVDNTGSTTLSVSRTDLLVDGVYQTGGTRTVDGTARDLWAPGETLRIELTTATTPSRVKVTTDHGVAATAEVTT